MWSHPIPSKINWTNLNIPYLCRFHTSYSFSSQMNLENIFNYFFSIYSYVKHSTPPLPYVAKLYPRESWLEQISIYTTRGCLHTQYSISGRMVLEKKIISSISSYVKFQPPLGPTLHPGVIIFTIENLHYLRMIPNKFQLS